MDDYTEIHAPKPILSLAKLLAGSPGGELRRGLAAFVVILGVVFASGLVRLNLAPSGESVSVAGISTEPLDSLAKDISGAPEPIWSIPAGPQVLDINLMGRAAPPPAPAAMPSTAVVRESTISASTVFTAPKWLAAPVLDGQCNDTAYEQAGTVALLLPDGSPGANVHLLHTGLDLYVCFSAIPVTLGDKAVVRFDTDHNRSRQLMPGDYLFNVTATGTISAAQGTMAGLWEPMGVPVDDFAAVILTGRSTWDAEMRIRLEWVGGYARMDGVSAAVEHADGTVQQQWPLSAEALLPATWGDLMLGPIYPDTVVAESAFLDGDQGYLVVPYAAELNPSEITVEAWVKAMDGDCGTLLGNGREVSYWLAFCGMIQFGHEGADSVDTGQQRLGDGWHHVAVTMDEARGIRTFYLDGLLDARFGWEPPHEERTDEGGEIAKLGVSDRMLRIGSDRHAPADLDRLHGYVSELRIWNRVRTAEEIQADAFRRLTGAEDGLVALWPFTTGLQDITGGHDAGLVGNASLAREGRDVTSFPPIPPPAPYDYPPREPIPAWTSHVPFTTREITLDGVCQPAEYPDESKLALEPLRTLSMRLLLAGDALYLCTNVMWGGPGLDSAVTLWINRDGQGGAAPGPADLRLRLLPDGTLLAGTGDGTGYTGLAPFTFASYVISDTQFAFQEDLYTISSPWWAGELRLPLEALAPFEPGQSLRFAVSFEGTIAAGALPDYPEETRVVGGWPADSDPLQPDTWGVATTQAPRVYLPWVARQFSGPASTDAMDRQVPSGAGSEASGPILISPEQALALRTLEPSAPSGWPRNPPSGSDFDAKCPGGLETPAYVFDKDYKWPRVDPTNFPVVQAEGILDSVGIAKEDSPYIHDSHDLDMKATIRYEDRWLVLNGGPSLVLETESGPFDARTIPVPGDHVTVQGRWIFDCGHAAKTEVHPIPIFESDRQVTLPDGVGTPGNRKTVRVARVWFNSQPGAFSYSFTGPFTFHVALPPVQYGGNKLLFLRVAEGPADKVALTGLTSTQAEITVTPPGVKGKYYFELVLGYLDTPNPASAAGMGYTVTIDKIWIYDDHDGGIPDCGPLTNPSDCGEWTMFVAMNDTWRKIFNNKEVWDEHDHDDYVVNQSFPVFGNDLRIRVIGFEGDDPLPGDWITRGEWNHGSLASLCCGVQQSAWHNDWRIFYTVQSGYHGLTALPEGDLVYWAFRLANEPNDPVRDDLGTLTVPAEGNPAYVKEKNAYITQSPLQMNGVYVLSQDVDRYKFALTDFADVSFVVPTGVQLHVDKTFPWTYAAGQVPPLLEDLGVYKSAWINVHGDTLAATDKLYTLKVSASWRPLPPDWGEDQDTLDPNGTGGRLVDLVTPDPDTQVSGETPGVGALRILTKDWAWQHVTGDIDYYDVWIPPIQDPPPDYAPTDCDAQGRLRLYAHDMHLRVRNASGTLIAEGNDSLELADLNAQFPDGHVYVRVSSITDQRGFYRLRAEWRDAHYYSVEECEALKALQQSIKDFGYPIVSLETLLYPFPFPGPGPEPIIGQVTLFGLGGYKPVAVEQGNTFDATISSMAGYPVVTRLYDGNGILLGEGVVLGDENIDARVPDGQVPQSRLTVGGLEAGEYYVQMVPAFEVGPAGAQEITVGFTPQMAGE
jgi:hypothetical protein